MPENFTKQGVHSLASVASFIQSLWWFSCHKIRFKVKEKLLQFKEKEKKIPRGKKYQEKYSRCQIQDRKSDHLLNI